MQMRSRPGRLEPGPRFVLLNKIMQDGVVLTDASSQYQTKWRTHRVGAHVRPHNHLLEREKPDLSKPSLCWLL